MSGSTTATSYDEVPYGDNVFAHTHPERIAAIATLFGIDAVPPEKCRVLELGCGTGANLIPMAVALPGSRFVGIDLSARQIDRGRETITALGLTNIDLQPLSILDVTPDFGTFDYLICHGVFSWVPAAVQDKILTICHDNIESNGIAYISYNTYPGWHIRGMIREMMGYHVRRFTDPGERVQQARAVLRFLIDAVDAPDTVWGGLLQVEADLLAGASDTYVYHEHLEDVNQPLYFHQFVERAATRGLQYVAEARPVPLTQNLSPRAAETLHEMAGDLIQGEQYLDFVRNRTFRRTLLCHDRVRLTRPPSAAALAKLWVAGQMRPASPDADPTAEGSEPFVTPDGTRLSTNNPWLKTALVTLADAWPRAVPFAELERTVCERVGYEPGAMARLDDALLQCYLADLIELQAGPTRAEAVPGERPATTALARLQAAAGGRVTNLRHKSLELDPQLRLLVTLLDGVRDRNAVVEGLAEVVQVNRDGKPIEDPEELRRILRPALDSALTGLARAGLLVSGE
jgi:methyltransferase-like protein/SAM-dependent methyltransferase